MPASFKQYSLFLYSVDKTTISITVFCKAENTSDAAREEAFGHVVDMLLEERAKAKANKDWATSDKIRNELTALGFEIKDGKERTEWKLNK